MEEENKTPRKNWDLMIGITLVFIGGFRLYNRLQTGSELNFRVIFTILFIGYGGFLIYKHFKSSKKN